MSVPPIFELADEREYADRSHCLARVAMPGTITSALADRVEAWLGVAMTKAKVRPVPETDLHCATLPPFRRFACNADTESGALMALRNELEAWAKGELVTGHALPTWESAVPEVTPAAKSLVRLSNLRHELRTRAAEWGGERQNLPAGAVERCLADIDALVTRHAMQINGSPPPPQK
ncbi:hypothetical protein [Prosthecobacter sp.]|uniref:hypothetical protein n=1 Tax=Prosthecobacter sp. TaxID=1965333 RepID=UPI0037830BC7